MKSLSIIMPYYKRLSAFTRAMRSNHANLTSTPERQTEVVLVLDEPTEEAAVLRVVSSYPDISWRVPINRRDHPWRNPSVAINVGLRHAVGEFVLVMSPETLHVTNVPQLLYGWSTGSPSHLALGRICWCARQVVDEKGLARAFAETEPKRYYGSVCGLRAAFEAVGGYDETNKTWGCDDDNLRARLMLTGLKLKYLPAARAIHPLETGEVNHNRIRRREKLSLERRAYERPSSFVVNGADWGREFDDIVYDREASVPLGVGVGNVKDCADAQARSGMIYDCSACAPSDARKGGSEFMSANGDRIYYNRFYARGGWEYSREQQKEFLIERLIKPLGLISGSKVLEIGCGMGLHSSLLYELGFEVVGVDVSEVGIQNAKTRFPGPTFHAMNLADEDFGEEEFDIIYSRGMSWYHYELNGVNIDGVDVPRQTEILFKKLKEGGLFILQISTDFSGGRDPQSGVNYNRLGEYVSLFERFGEVVHVSNWRGEKLESQEQAERLKGHIIIATQK